MATVTVSRSGINSSVVEALLTGPGHQDALRRGVRVMTKARDNLTGPPRRIDTGRLRASIGIRESVPGKPGAVSVGTNVDYAPFVHDGTRFMEANPFLLNALESVAG